MTSKLSIVATSNASLADFGVIEARINQITDAATPRNIAFARLVLNDVFAVNGLDANNCIVDGGADRGIDIVFIDSDNKVINFCSCKCVSKYKNSRHNFPGDEVDKILSIMNDIFYRNEGVLDQVNGTLAAYIRQVWDIVEEGEFSIKFHMFSNQARLVRLERDRLVNGLAQHRIEVFEHSLFELAHGVVRAAKPRFQKRLRPLPGKAFDYEEGNTKGLQIAVSLSELVKFLTDGNKEFDERLLSHNVRYFLGLDNSVNAAIRNTIISGKAERFWSLNNGITIVCDQIIGLRNGFYALNLKNPKIVNGGQTACVVFDALKMLGNDRGSVAIKIIETDEEKLIEEIAISTNSQSRIYGRDLRAFDVFQEKLAKNIEILGYFYKRKRSEKSEHADKKTIDMARAGQILLAYLCGEPTLSKTAANEIFDGLYETAFDSSVVTGELIVAAFRCYERIEAKRQEALIRSPADYFGAAILGHQ